MSEYEDDYDEENEGMYEVEDMFGDESGGDSDTWLTGLGTYEGQTNGDGERHGFGRAVLPNGDVYAGMYMDGFRHGLGLYEFRNGAKYRGYYRDGLKDGKGIMCYPNKTRYEGCWSNNKRHGHGNFKYENGDTFSGTWKSDMKCGPGTYTFCRTGAVLNGTWSADRRIGNFQMFFPTSAGPGFTYHGTWDGDQSVAGEGYFVFEHLKCMQRGVHVKNRHRGTAKSDRGRRDAKSTWVPYQILPIVIGMLPRLSKRRPSFIGRPSCEPRKPTSPAVRSTGGSVETYGRVETYDRDEYAWTETDGEHVNDDGDGTESAAAGSRVLASGLK